MSDQIKNHLTANGHLSKKKIMINNFLGGLAWGLGSVIGASIIAALLIFLLKSIGIFNIFTNFINQNKTSSSQLP